MVERSRNASKRGAKLVCKIARANGPFSASKLSCVKWMPPANICCFILWPQPQDMIGFVPLLKTKKNCRTKRDSLVRTARNSYGSFTLAKLSAISRTITPAISCRINLLWPIEMILSVSHCPRWPKQVQWWLSCVALAGIIAGIIALTFANGSTA